MQQWAARGNIQQMQKTLAFRAHAALSGECNPEYKDREYNCTKAGQNKFIALNFRGSLMSRILQIFNHSQKYFNENLWHMAFGVRVQWICKIISTKSSEIAIRENLDSQKFCTIRYVY